MSTNSNIEWTNASWNPVVGCSAVSEGCRNCYAVRESHRHSRLPAYKGLTVLSSGKRHFNGKVRVLRDRLDDPLHWRKPRRVFVNSMSDLFHEQVPFEFVDEVFATMALARAHTFQILTKRPQRMLEYFNGTLGPGLRPSERVLVPLTIPIGSKSWPLPNVWLGVSVEDQKTADERIPLLLQCPAAVRFLSCEPLLGPIDLNLAPLHSEAGECTAWHQGDFQDWCTHRVHWIIVGGESGPGARPMHPDWARSIRDQCQAAGIPFFFKQWGEWLPCRSTVFPAKDFAGGEAFDDACGGRTSAEYARERADYHYFESDRSFMRRVGKKKAGRSLDGREWNEYPEVKV